jgi:hypothetical protein
MTKDDSAGCCSPVHGCVFAKALLARAASCECAGRRQSGEATVVDCRSPVARHNCATLVALLAERGRFALRLPPASRPMLHAQAMRLQCGGVAALREHLRGPGAQEEPQATDVHRLVLAAQERHRSLADLPWAELVPRMQAWAPRRRGPARP